MHKLSVDVPGAQCCSDWETDRKGLWKEWEKEEKEEAMKEDGGRVLTLKPPLNNRNSF